MKDRFENKPRLTIGVISDTHGLLRPEVAEIFKHVDLIIHAGDIGNNAIFQQLNEIAPMIAVRGNMDQERWSDAIPNTQRITLGDARFFILHSLYDMDVEMLEPVDVIISGHTHKPLIKKDNHILYINPGSAGPRRCDYPISVALVTVNRKDVTAQIIEFQ